MGLSFINRLNPIEYRKKSVKDWPKAWGKSNGPETNTRVKLHGLTAQEVRTALDAEGVEEFSGWAMDKNSDMQRLGETPFIYPLINAVKELAAENVAMRAMIEKRDGATA